MVKIISFAFAEPGQALPLEVIPIDIMHIGKRGAEDGVVKRLLYPLLAVSAFPSLVIGDDAKGMERIRFSQTFGSRTGGHPIGVLRRRVLVHHA